LAEPSRSLRDAPRRIELAVLCESREHVTGEIEGVDDAVALAGHIVFLLGTLNCISDEQPVADRDDVERSITARQMWIYERVRRKRHMLAGGVVHMYRAGAAVGGVQPVAAGAVRREGRSGVDGAA